MAWTGISMGTGIVIAVLGAIVLVVGGGVALVGPEAVSDENCCQDEGFLGLGGDSGADQRNAEERQEVRAAGGAIAGIGAALLMIGGLFYGVGRAVESSRSQDQQQTQTVEIR